MWKRLTNAVARIFRSFIWRIGRNVFLRDRKVNVSGVRLYVNPDDSVVSRKFFVRRSWEPLEVQEIRKRVSIGSVCIDIGAHIGFYSLVLADAVGEYGTVVAFEPSQENFAYLLRNCSEHSNIICENIALSNTPGQIKLFVSDKHKGDHRIYQPLDEAPRRVESIKSTTLSDYIETHSIPPEDISIVKIDTQGAEPYILEGMKAVIERMKRATFFVEFWPRAYEMQASIDCKEYINYLYDRFLICDLNYVLNSYRPISSSKELSKLYVDHLRQEHGVDHSTLVLNSL